MFIQGVDEKIKEGGGQGAALFHTHSGGDGFKQPKGRLDVQQGAAVIQALDGEQHAPFNAERMQSLPEHITRDTVVRFFQVYKATEQGSLLGFHGPNEVLQRKNVVGGGPPRPEPGLHR
jgi:hypothetical protein